MPKILIRPILSKKRRALIDVIRKEQATALKKEIVSELIRRFDEIVENWQHKPVFRSRIMVRDTGTTVYVFPTGSSETKQIWEWVSVTGTKRHLIKVKKAKALRFPWAGKGSYVPKTKKVGRNATYGGPGVVPGGKTHYYRQVDHPGFEPRNFEKVVGDEFEDDFRKICENATRRAIRRYERGG